jgi:hypothetical protein
MVIKSLPLLVASITAFFLLGGLLVWVVVRLLRSNREQLLASGPMTVEQEFALREAAALLLLIEVPRFGSGFRQLEFEVVERASGRATKLSYDFVRAQGAVYGVTTMRVPLGRVIVERPGSYLVRVGGLRPGADYSRTYGLADHWHRDLRDRHVVKPAPRLVAGSASATGMTRSGSNGDALFVMRQVPAKHRNPWTEQRHQRDGRNHHGGRVVGERCDR